MKHAQVRNKGKRYVYLMGVRNKYKEIRKYNQELATNRWEKLGEL